MKKLKNSIINIITFLYSLVIMAINMALIVGIYNNYFSGIYLIGVILLIHLLVASVFAIYDELKEIRFN